MNQEVPFSVEAEKAVLASLLIAPDMFHEVADILEWWNSQERTSRRIS